MKKKLLIALGVAAALVLVFVLVVALQPSHYQVRRSAIVQAPPATVFAQIDDFHRWEAWSPWLQLDPNSKNTYAGPAAGKDASFAWDGNDDVGAGSMIILESRPPEAVQIQLAFTRPMQSACTVDFALQTEGAGTKVVWTMQGENDFFGKAFCMFMDMDTMIGGDFERGLANLKKVCETAAPADLPTSAPAPEITPAPAPAAPTPDN